MRTPPYNPDHVNMIGLGYSRFARRYSGNRKNLLPGHNGSSTEVDESDQKESSVFCFLFLSVLECFTSRGARLLTQTPIVDRKVSPFRDLRIVGCVSPPRSISQTYHVFHRSS